jgi:hypothetical protein
LAKTAAAIAGPSSARQSPLPLSSYSTICGAANNCDYVIRAMPSQVSVSGGGSSGGIGNGTSPSKRVKISAKNLAVVKNRFLEMFIHQMPPYHQRDLAITRRVTFDRSHFIVGTFTRALKTLEQYSPDDFHSEHLNNYVIGVLRKNSLFYEEVMGEGHQDHYERVLCLSQKYNFHF